MYYGSGKPNKQHGRSYPSVQVGAVSFSHKYFVKEGVLGRQQDAG